MGQRPRPATKNPQTRHLLSAQSEIKPQEQNLILKDSKTSSAACCDTSTDCCVQGSCCTETKQCCPSQVCCTEKVDYVCQGGTDCCSQTNCCEQQKCNGCPCCGKEMACCQ